MKKSLGNSIILLSLVGLLNIAVFSQKKIPGRQFVQNNIQKTAVDPTSTIIDIGNITSWISDNGQRPALFSSSWNGSFPKGFIGGVVYQEGILWGGLVNDGLSPAVRVGGNTYFNGTTALTRIVRVRTDYKTADLTEDAANFFQTFSSSVTADQIQQIYDQYDKDWQEWPANLGAPYSDVNKDGVYEPNVDIPGIPGASQTIFISYDDRNSLDAYGSPPIGFLINETIWSYSADGPLGNSIFKKVDLIYEGTSQSASNSQIDSMYIVQWVDPDIGLYTDDFAGCDSLLNLGYAYNSGSNDAVYSLAPPAVGYTFLQGVSQYTGNPSDSAMFNFKWRSGYKYVNNKPLSTFDYFAVGGAWTDPAGQSYTGTLQWYSLMRGYLPNPYPDLSPFPSPYGFMGGDGTYLLAGDPLTGTGWIDGQAESAGDRRISNVSGPFTLKLGDTVQVVSAETGANSNSAIDAYLLSVKRLKESSSFITQFFNNSVAAIVSGPDIININSQVNLTATIYPAIQPGSTNWSMTQMPAGSNAQLSSTQGLSTSFIPDVSGDYIVTFTASVNGVEVSDVKTVKAVLNHSPVAKLNLDKNQIISGDSILVDYSQSYDPDNDALTFNFNGSGIFRKDTANKKAYFIPYPWTLGSTDINMMVYDTYSYDSASAKINISPKLDKIKISYSYLDTNWIMNSQNPLNGFMYYKGSDTLYVPMVNSLRRYKIYSDSLSLVEENNQVKIDGIWTIKGNLLFAATDRSMTGFFGTLGKLSIYDLSNGGNVVLSGYLPGSSAIVNILQIDSDIYLIDQGYDIYKMNFNTPSSPQIVASASLLRNGYNFWKSDADYLYFIVRGALFYNLQKLNKSDLTLAGSSDLPFSSDLGLSINNDLIIVHYYDYPNSASDTLYFYNYDGVNAPAFISKLDLSSLIANPYTDYVSYNSGYGLFNDSLLVLYKYWSVKIYDIADLNNIKYVGAWYGGGSSTGALMSLNKSGSNFFISPGDPRFSTIDNPYSGVNKVTLDFLTDVKNINGANALPVTYTLYQNYPNPFNPTTTISFSVPKTSLVTIKVYDILGRELKTLVNEEKAAGNYNVKFNGANLSSGVYFYRMQAGDFVQTRKLMLMK